MRSMERADINPSFIVIIAGTTALMKLLEQKESMASLVSSTTTEVAVSI
jgi:hypothetical protein